MSRSTSLPICNAGQLPLRLDRNDQGAAIFDYVPGLKDLYCGDRVPAPGYRGGHGCAETALFHTLIAKFERVPEQNLRTTGSLLPLLRHLPSRLGHSKLVTLSGDFPKYHDTSALSGLEWHEIEIDPHSDTVSADLVADRVRALGPATFFITVPRLNPSGNRVGENLIKRILEANPQIVIVLDTAYQRCAPRRHVTVDNLSYGQFAISHPRVLCLQTANKAFGSLCAFKASWLIGSSAILQVIDKYNPDPYAIPADGLARAIRFIQAESHLHEMTKIQMKAKKILVDELERLRFALRATMHVPWVLMHVGEGATALAERLVEQGVHLQVQKMPQLIGWLRVSATTPCEARLFVRILKKVMSRQQEKDIK